MSDVWSMANEVAKVIGWIVLYFWIGKRVARRIQPPPKLWTAYRVAAAVAWPLVVLWLVLKWFGLLLWDLGCSGMEWLRAGQPPTEDPYTKKLEVLAQVQAKQLDLPANYRELSDGEQLKRLYADRQALDRRIKEITDRLAQKPRSKSASN